MNIDFYPTLIAAAGVTPPTSQILDGQSQLALWRNPKSTAQRPSLFWHYPLDQPHFLGGVSAAAIREGDWKLIEFLNDKRFELYSLKSDPSETRNLARQYPKVTQALHQKLVSWQREVNARTPSPPLLSEARQLYLGDHFSSGHISKRWTHYGAWRLRDGQLVVDESSQQAEPAQLSIPAFKNTIIRFDFKLPKSGQLRLTLGTEQHDHTVLNIHGNRFYFETQEKASLKGFPVKPNEWQTMTIEWVEQHLLAHAAADAFAYTEVQGSIGNKPTLRFAAGQRDTAIDNIQVFGARPAQEWEKKLRSISRSHSK